MFMSRIVTIINQLSQLLCLWCSHGSRTCPCCINKYPHLTSIKWENVGGLSEWVIKLAMLYSCSTLQSCWVFHFLYNQRASLCCALVLNHYCVLWCFNYYPTMDVCGFVLSNVFLLLLQESEIYQKCIRPPPNRTVLESESPPPYRSSSAGLLGSIGSSSSNSGSSEWSGGGSAPLVVRCHSMSSSSTSSSSTSKRPEAGPSGGQKTDFIQRTVKIFTGKKSQQPPAPTLPPPVVVVPLRPRQPPPPSSTTEQQQNVLTPPSSTAGRPKPNV